MRKKKKEFNKINTVISKKLKIKRQELIEYGKIQNYQEFLLQDALEIINIKNQEFQMKFLFNILFIINMINSLLLHLISFGWF